LQRVDENRPCDLLFSICQLALEMEGPPPDDVDFSSLSIEDALNHKNWKARVSGYERLAKDFRLSPSEDAAIFRPYLNNPDVLKKAVTDSNVAAQEKAVECACQFVEFAGKSATSTREVILPGVVDKCLGSTRASIKTKAIELCELYTEVEGSAAGVVVSFAPPLSCSQNSTSIPENSLTSWKVSKQNSQRSLQLPSQH
jgi:cytoskeleton-associated protein 5